MSKRTLKLAGVSLVAVGVVALLSVSLPAQHAGHGDMRIVTAKPAAKPMQAKPAHDLAAALKAIDAATKLVARGKKDAALAELKKARHLVAASHKALTAHRAPKVINTLCPIMGAPVKAGDVPANLVREFKGRKVLFCCAGCPAAWDKLSDAEKVKKLHAAADKAKKDKAREGHHPAGG